MLQRLWQFTEFPFHPEKLLYYETIFAIGNGYLTTRATFEEGLNGDMPATLVHGIYDHAPGALVPELVNAPNWLEIKIHIDGTLLQMVNQNEMSLTPVGGALLGFRRTLHLDTGILRREVLFRAQSGSIVRVVFERFASLSDVHLLCQRVQITGVEGSPGIEIESALDADVSNNGVRHWLPNVTMQGEGDTLGLEVTAQQSGYVLGLASHFSSPHPVASYEVGLRPYTSAKFTLNRQQTFTFEKITTIFTSRDTEKPLLSALAKVKSASSKGYESLREDHIAEWAKYWSDSDIQLEGDEEAQRALRFAMYHLLIAAPRHDDRVSIGAKTLSGFGYKGHVFWDTELFILPPLTLTQPKIAKNLLMYRYHNLTGARNKAKANGYEGAMFPWESTDTGEETTPQWSDPQPDGTKIRIWTGDSEQHISTDIAYGVNQFWRWTADDEFMCHYGAELILDTAVFWGSRVEAKNGRYEISQQIGADEYHENVDNSVFTNRMVVWHLQTALKVLDWLKTHSPSDAERLIGALDLTPERLVHWRDIIEKMFIPFDTEKQIHVQFPGFFDLEFVPVLDYEPRTSSVQGILSHERTLKTQVIKQADVVMLMALLGHELGSNEVMLNNWNTYYPRTDHGSSLSPAVHARVAARLGLDDLAHHLFDHAAGIDLNDNKGNVRDGIHAAACGGLWQALVFGFCGLHIDQDGALKVAPRLPEHWKKVSFSVYYRGEKRQFSVENTQ
jgi:kojibiose phosphorylase